MARQIAVGERLAAIGRVAGGIAHEIRNPLAAMRLKAENALATGGERHREALSVIVTQISRLDGLVRRLLNVTERDPPRRKTVSLGSFLDGCLATHAELAALRQITLERHVEIEAACFDPEQVGRAVDNLVANAIQAAPMGSRGRVAARRCDSQLVLSVRDSGEGPPPQIRDHLFEPFVTGRSDGTGLGLSIVREVAEAHGGMARFTTCDTGTAFEIIVPWQPS